MRLVDRQFPKNASHISVVHPAIVGPPVEQKASLTPIKYNLFNKIGPVVFAIG